MKLITMAAALMLGSAAVAQTTTPEPETDTTATDTATTETTTTQTVPEPDAATSIPPPATAAPTSAPPMGNMSNMGTGSGQTVAPGNTSPETDARGIRVISAPAEAPAGYNQGARTVPAGSAMPTVAAPTPTAAGQLPPCTRTVTDRCTQTYERGRAR